MKRIIIFFFTFFALTCASFAQNDFRGNRPSRERMDPAEMMKRRTQMMVEQYGLTQEQAAAVQALNEKYFSRQGQRQERNDSVRPERRERQQGNRMNGERRQRRDNNEGASPRGERRGQGGQRMGGNFGGRGMQNMEEYNNELKQILTPEQYAKYEENMQAMRQRFSRN